MEIQLTHLLLAYAGMIVHMLVRLAELYKSSDSALTSYVKAKANLFTIAASIIMIPLLLMMATEPAVKETLPVNNITAVLCGYQTNDIFKSLMGMYMKPKTSMEDVG